MLGYYFVNQALFDILGPLKEYYDEVIYFIVMHCLAPILSFQVISPFPQIFSKGYYVALRKAFAAHPLVSHL